MFSAKLSQDELLNLGLAVNHLRELNIFQDDREMEDFYVSKLNQQQEESKSTREYCEIIRRLLTLLRVNGDHCSKSSPVDLHQFNPDQFTGYESDNVFFLKYPQFLVQRYQLSGNCYLHAPALLQFYLSSLATGKRENMLDISRYVRQNFSSRDLKNHIINDDGGSSFQQFFNLTGQYPRACNPSDIRRSYERYGPGLVCQFKVYDDFRRPNKFLYHQSPQGINPVGHAMILVGFRTDSQDNVFLLLQNWWKEKQFVEVTPSYLADCGATVYFAESPVSPLKSDCPQLIGSYTYYEAEGTSI